MKSFITAKMCVLHAILVLWRCPKGWQVGRPESQSLVNFVFLLNLLAKAIGILKCSRAVNTFERCLEKKKRILNRMHGFVPFPFSGVACSLC